MERWDAVNRYGKPLGHTLLRGLPIPDGQYHQVSGILVRHQDGSFLLMKRHPNKESWPNVYEASAGGAVLAGEDLLTAAKRELAEETGITRGRFTPLYADRGRHTLYHGYLCETDWPKDAITLQEGETVGYRWVSGEEILRMDPIRPHVLILQPGIRAWLKGAKPPVLLADGLISAPNA